MSAYVRQEDFEHCLELVRENANDFYLADLLLPQEARADIVVLHAFHVEITNIALATREPIAGEVRLQWWADVIAGQREEEAGGHPVARALLNVVERHSLSREALDAKLTAHIFDLYNDPMGNRNMLEGYCGETRSVLFHMAALICGAEPTTPLADASGHAGVAMGIIGMIENLAWHRNKGRLYVPSELLQATGLSAEEFLTGQSNAHEQVVLGMIDFAKEHQLQALRCLESMPSSARIAFKPFALANPHLRRARKNPNQAFAGFQPFSQVRRQWVLWRGLRVSTH